MKLSFRWYGADDKVTLENIRQIPKMEAIVTADRKSTRLNSSHPNPSRMPSSA